MRLDYAYGATVLTRDALRLSLMARANTCFQGAL